jgi:hypothetical protein
MDIGELNVVGKALTDILNTDGPTRTQGEDTLKNIKA